MKAEEILKGMGFSDNEISAHLKEQRKKSDSLSRAPKELLLEINELSLRPKLSQVDKVKLKKLREQAESY